MAEYSFWAIRNDDIVWNSDRTSFVINDSSKFVTLAVSDDDAYLQDGFALSGVFPTWVRDDRETGYDATYVDGPADIPVGGVATSIKWYKFSDFPNGKLIELGENADYTVFQGVEPGQFAEGETINVVKWTGNESGSVSSGSAPTVAYDDIVNPIICFTSGTLIETNEEQCPKVGDGLLRRLFAFA